MYDHGIVLGCRFRRRMGLGYVSLVTNTHLGCVFSSQLTSAMEAMEGKSLQPNWGSIHATKSECFECFNRFNRRNYCTLWYVYEYRANVNTYLVNRLFETKTHVWTKSQQANI